MPETPPPGLLPQLVHAATTRNLGPLLEAGVHVYEYEASLLHAKTLMIDDHWAAVGSANFDPVSWTLSDELMVVIEDEHTARVLAGQFARDRERSRDTTLEMWRDRPFTTLLWEWLARPFWRGL